MDQPKVRFSQTSDSIAVHAGDEDAFPNKSKGKVKIKSIEPADYSFKILKNGQRVLLREQKSNSEIKNQSSLNNASGYSKFDSSTSSNSSILYISKVADSSPRNGYENVSNPKITLDNKSIKTRDDNLEDCIDNLQHFSLECSSKTLNCPQQTHKNLEKDKECESLESSKNDSFKSCLDDNKDSDIEVIYIESPRSKKVTQKPILSNHTTKNRISKDKKKNVKEEDKENTRIKDITSNNQQSNKKTKILKDTIDPSSVKNQNISSKKITKLQNKKIQLMPCAKFREASLPKNKSAGKVKKAEVRKTEVRKAEVRKTEVRKAEVRKTEVRKAEVRKSMVYNTAGSHNSVSVEPGTFHKKCSHPVNNDIDESYEKRDIASEDLLSRPEYNSTICVMKKLKKLENEKLITDFQHLPQEYKNLIFGKVSAGLDVAPYECIYKDLIDISIDDNKLPTRLMRSKDPEPRDKDIVPKISDFYQPKYAEQYFIVASPVVPRPVNLNTLSAFTIINKICIWKNARDNF